MSIDFIPRKQSVITGKNNLEHLYTFKDFPVFMGCVDSPSALDLKADMSWCIDPDSGVIQLENLIPTNILYQTSHNDGTGLTWENYYQDFSQFIYKTTKPMNILEIGGGAGRIAEIYTQKSPGSTWTIIEPNPLRKESDSIKIVNGFFDENSNIGDKFDTIVHSQVLEHAFDPNIFLKNIHTHLPKNGNLVFAYPNLEYFLKNKHTNALNFEHTIFLTDIFVDFLLAKNGFSIIKKYNYKNRDFFYHVIKNENSNVSNTKFENKYGVYKKIFMDFVDYHVKLIDKLNNSIDSFEGDIYIFGAHIFCQYLLSFGLKQSKIKGVLDNSPLKQGKRLYGTNFIVSKPEILAQKKHSAVILKVGIYREEILNQLQKINPSTIIFE